MYLEKIEDYQQRIKDLKVQADELMNKGPNIDDVDSDCAAVAIMRLQHGARELEATLKTLKNKLKIKELSPNQVERNIATLQKEVRFLQKWMKQLHDLLLLQQELHEQALTAWGEYSNYRRLEEHHLKQNEKAVLN